MDFSSLPEHVRPLAESRWRDLAFDGVLPNGVADVLPRVFAWSGFVVDVLRRQPQLLEGDWLRQLHDALPSRALTEQIERESGGLG